MKLRMYNNMVVIQMSKNLKLWKRLVFSEIASALVLRFKWITLYIILYTVRYHSYYYYYMAGGISDTVR